MAGAINVLMLDRSRFACLRMATMLANEGQVSFHFATEAAPALALAEQLRPTVVLYSPDANHPSGLPEQLRARAGGAALLVLGDPETDLPDSERLDLFVEKDVLLRRLARCSAAQSAASRQTAASIPAGSRVLLIDDSSVVCKAFEQQLAPQPDITFESCLDPTLGLAVAERFRPTVILLDLEMPQISGFELIERFRENAATATVPIIVLSGIEDVSAKVRAFGLGASDYAVKKMERVELTSRIAYHSHAYHTAQRLAASVTELTAAKHRLERQGAFLRRTFGRYLSDEIVASILETPEGLELGGEKRVVSLLMTDLRGFTGLGERLAPQDLLALLNNYLGAMTEVLLAYAGTIDEFIGDAILAVFGAPQLRSDDAERAVACAVAMQLAMKDVNTWNRQRGYPPLAMGIGINTGEVVVGNIGSERRAKYGVVGANVNLTARIESHTLGGQILASGATVAACGTTLRLDDELDVLPKGFTHPIKIHSVGGIGGEHQLYLPSPKPLALEVLARPRPAVLAKLEESGAPATPHDVRLVKLGDNSIELSGARGMQPLCNVRLLLQSGREQLTLYGKVGRLLADGNVLLHLTSLPPKAEQLLERWRAEG